MAGLSISSTPAREVSRFRNWKKALLTMSVDGTEPDAVSRWLIMTRAAVIPMTLTSGLIGGLLAIGSHPDWHYFLLALVALVLAHATNNLINDYFDLDSGVDDADAPRALYAPHPVLSGWISKRRLMATIIGLTLIDAAIAIVFFEFRGWPVLAFAAAGFFISVFYVAPPFRLKHRGLGEPGVFIVWGPLMVCGTYFVTTGALPGWVWAASIPYAILVTTVLIGKHIDKLPYDSKKGVRTLPVILGDEVSRRLNGALMLLFYPTIIILILADVLGVWTVLPFFGGLPLLKRVLNVYGDPKPQAAPEGYRMWPLWYAPSAFLHARRAGGLLVLGLLVNAIFPSIYAAVYPLVVPLLPKL